MIIYSHINHSGCQKHPSINSHKLGSHLCNHIFQQLSSNSAHNFKLVGVFIYVCLYSCCPLFNEEQNKKLIIKKIEIKTIVKGQKIRQKIWFNFILNDRLRCFICLVDLIFLSSVREICSSDCLLKFNSLLLFRKTISL